MHLKLTLATFLVATSTTLAAPQTDYPLLATQVATFWTHPNFEGNQFPAWAPYGACQNLPVPYNSMRSFPGGYDSTGVNRDPVVCCVYLSQHCDTNDYWTTVPANVAEFEGEYWNNVKAFRCSRWQYDWSTCYDDTVPGPNGGSIGIL